MKPIPGLDQVRLVEFLTFEVPSQSDPAKTYRVDKTLWFGSGACSCEQFCCRIQPKLGKGDWTEPTTCKHIQQVDRFLACQVARQAIEHKRTIWDGHKLTTKQYNPSEPNL